MERPSVIAKEFHRAQSVLQWIALMGILGLVTVPSSLVVALLAPAAFLLFAVSLLSSELVKATPTCCTLNRTHQRRKVAVIGAGPSGLAAAREIMNENHDVVIFERSDKLGGAFSAA